MPAAAAVAIVGSAAIGASAQSKAAKKAANAQVQAADQANATQLAIYQDQRNLSIPTARAGAEARARQMLMQGFSREDVRRFLSESNAAFNAPAPGTDIGGAPASNAQSEAERQAARFALMHGGAGFGFANLINGPDGSIDEQDAGPTPASTQISGGQNDPYGWVDDWSYESASPSYGFRFDEGQRALERSAAARGRLFSGATGRELTRYGQDFASQEFENDFRRLGNLSGAGDDATGDIIVNAGQYGDNVSRNQMAAGQARASGYQQSGQAWGNFWGNTIPGAIGFGYGQGWFGK